MINKFETIRLDKLLYYLRFFKTRSNASKNIINGKIKINGILIKKNHKLIQVNDLIEIKFQNTKKTIKISSLPNRRGSYKDSINYFLIINEEINFKKTLPHLDKNTTGRPTKRNRRKLDKLIGRN